MKQELWRGFVVFNLCRADRITVVLWLQSLVFTGVLNRFVFGVLQHSLCWGFLFVTSSANRGYCFACTHTKGVDTPTAEQWSHLWRAWSLTVNILITRNHWCSRNAGISLLWPWISAQDVLVRRACRNKLHTQKEKSADLLNVLIQSHFLSVIIHQCREDDKLKLHQFKRKRKKELFPFWFLLCQTSPVCCSVMVSSYFLLC